MYDCVSQPTQKHVLVNVEMNRYCELEERLALSRYQLSSCVRRILEDGIIQAERARREVYGVRQREEMKERKEEEKDEENEGKALVRRATRQLQNCKN